MQSTDQLQKSWRSSAENKVLVRDMSTNHVLDFRHSNTHSKGDILLTIYPAVKLTLVTYQTSREWQRTKCNRLKQMSATGTEHEEDTFNLYLAVEKKRAKRP